MFNIHFNSWSGLEMKNGFLKFMNTELDGGQKQSIKMGQRSL